MEASDAFTQGLEADGDPFGEDGMGDFETAGTAQKLAEEDLASLEAEQAVDPDPDMTAAAHTTAELVAQAAAPEGEPEPAEEEIPIVHASGQPVDEAEAERLREAERARKATVARPTVGSDGQPIPQPAPRAPAGAPPPHPLRQREEALAESTAQGSTPEGDPEPAEDEAPAGAPSATAVKAPPKAKGIRNYLLFVPDGPGKFSQLTWCEDKDGNIVEKGIKKSSVEAREQEEALAVGWAVLGSKAAGVKLVAVAESHWQVRHVGPDKTPPKKVPLKIS